MSSLVFLSLTRVIPAGSAVVLIGALALTPVHADTMSIRADNWYPMNGDPTADKPGYMIELAQTIFAKHGITVDYKTMPWERSVDMARRGEFDCVVGAYKDDAPDFLFPGEPWGVGQSAFYVKAGNTWRYTGLDSLASKTIGLIGGYAYEEDFDKYVAENAGSFQNVNGDNAAENNIKKVLAGRIDAMVEHPSVMTAKLKEMGLEGQIELAGVLAEAVDMYIACSPAKSSSEEYLKLVDEGTRALRASGELAEILRRYGLSDWQ
jgi:polar amino acid transport system substrate-binding protein